MDRQDVEVITGVNELENVIFVFFKKPDEKLHPYVLREDDTVIRLIQDCSYDPNAAFPDFDIHDQLLD